MAEGAPLLREYTSKAYRGFESLRLRQRSPVYSCYMVYVLYWRPVPDTWVTYYTEDVGYTLRNSASA